MIPEHTRTGEADVKEMGFTSHFSVNGENHSFSVRYYSDEWRDFPDHMKRQLSELVSCLWVAAIPSENKIFTHRLSEPDVEYLKFIAHQTQTLYRHNMKYNMIEDTPTLYVTEGKTDWNDMDLSTDGCGVYFSGGRDSFYTLGVLEDAGYDPQLIMVNNGPSWEAGEKARVQFTEELDRGVDTIWCNFNVLKREITKDHSVFWNPEAPIFHMTWLLTLPILKNELNFFGNGIATTRFISAGEERALNDSWGQSIVSNEVMREWAREQEMGVRVGSILRESSNFRIAREMSKKYSSYLNFSVSCEKVDKEDNFSPCCKCYKCQRNYLCLKAINENVSRYDEEKIKEFKMDPSEMMWKSILPTDMSQLNFYYQKHPDVPEQLRKEVEGLMFKKPYSNPSHFLTRDEFKSIYQEIVDGENMSLPSEPGPSWIPTEDLDHVYDVVQEWGLPTLEPSVIVRENNSLLNV